MNNENNNVSNDIQNNNPAPVTEQSKGPNLIVIGVIAAIVIGGLIFGVTQFLGGDEPNPNNGNQNGGGTNTEAPWGARLESEDYVIEFKLNDDFKYISKEDYTLPIITDGSLFHMTGTTGTYLLMFTGELIIREVKHNQTESSAICIMQPLRVMLNESHINQHTVIANAAADVVWLRNQNEHHCKLIYPQDVGREIPFKVFFALDREFEPLDIEFWATDSSGIKTNPKIITINQVNLLN